MSAEPSASAGVRAAVSVLKKSFAGSLEVDASLGTLTSLKVGGPAALLATPETEEDLLLLAGALKEFNLPSVVLGRGTNVLVSDAGFPGIVIRLGTGFEWIRGEGERVEAGGATPLPQVANWAARRRLTGMEFAIAIPATVGGAVRMNAGAHHSQVSEVLVSARICRLEEQCVHLVLAEDLSMSYRNTLVGAGDVVCSAVFQLGPGDPVAISQRMKDYRSHRLSTQPSDGPNAGSFFGNPPGSSAGGLIESAGLKGTRIGGAEVSPKHANFLLAHPGATAQDVYDLMVLVQSKVLEQTGVRLFPEVRSIGFFRNRIGELGSE